VSNASLAKASSSERLGSACFEQREDLIALHRWEALEKIVDGFPAFKVVEEAPYWNTSPDEHRRSTLNLGINVKDFSKAGDDHERTIGR